jgi:hypothetical protein
VSEDRPSQLRDELRRRRLQRASELQEATPLRLVGRYPMPVPATETSPPEIPLEASIPAPGPDQRMAQAPRRSSPGGMLMALMMVPAVVALISTSLLLYVLVADRYPELFASSEPEATRPLDDPTAVQAVEEPASEALPEEEPAETPEPSRLQVAPRYGLAPSKAPRPAQAARDPRPELPPPPASAAQAARGSQPAHEAPKPQAVPETQAIDISAQTAPVTMAPMVAPPQQAPVIAPQPSVAAQLAQVPQPLPASAAQAGQGSQPGREAPKLQSAPETQAIDISIQTAPVTMAPMVAPSPVAAGPRQSAALSAPQAAPPQAGPQRVPPQLVAQWGDPSLQPVQTGSLTVPNDAVLLLLIRSSLFALHRSNVTGDYNILRNISSVQFHNANPAPKLFQAFANMRARNLDLSLVMMVQPKLFGKPQITPRGILRVKGFFPTEPQRIIFDLMFERGPQGRWRLFGITADLATPKAAAAQPGALSMAAQPNVAPQGPQQLAPADSVPAAMPQASGESAPPLPTRKPAAPAPVRRQSQAPVEERLIEPVTSFDDVHDRVDEADTPPKRKRIWPFRN